MTTTTASGRKAAHTRSRRGPTKDELYARAKAKGVEGRSKMTKQQLANAVG
ncbi:MAG: Rho termination factor N-terminal domain-containing protein [Caulobacteraceae bacterium]|nr:Rho termination factor N-terminal domain-containing protein [Caulobacteraceae bacterium]